MSMWFNQVHHAQKDAMQYIDLNDIFEFPDIMMSANDEYTPSLEDILKL